MSCETEGRISYLQKIVFSVSACKVRRERTCQFFGIALVYGRLSANGDGCDAGVRKIPRDIGDERRDAVFERKHVRIV